MQIKTKKSLLGFILVIFAAQAFAEMGAISPKNVEFIPQKNMLASSEDPQNKPNIPKIQLVEPYVVEILVSGENGKERMRGFSEGLKMILMQDDNSSTIMAHPEVQVALSKSSRYVKQYVYVDRKLDKNRSILFLKANFDQKAISKLLQRASKIKWVDNKPTVLLWLAEKDAKNADGGMILTDKNIDNKIANILRKKSKELGVNVILPILDLNEIKMVKAKNICNSNIDLIKPASARYGVSVIALGCLEPTVSRDVWSSKWLLSQDDKQESFIFRGISFENVVTQALQTIANNISSVVTPVMTTDSRVLLRITNVSDLKQHKKIIEYLKKFNNINQVDLTNVGASNIELTVDVVDGKESLVDILNKQTKMVPDLSEMVLPAGVDLSYIWINS